MTGLRIPNRVARYLVAGIVCYGVEVAVLLGLGRLHVSNAIAVTASFWLGLVASFLAQKLFSFGDKRVGRVVAGQVLRYLALVGFNYLFTLLVVVAVGTAWPVIWTRTGCLAVTTVWNYFVYGRIIFDRGREPGPQLSRD
ncbi:MAG: GtrA family protein [Bifidobacteriaceae bacterium]|jgi:putative flippase GtrA|nr:GtrA family protein [Bifidobacteriaceae bacterium]